MVCKEYETASNAFIISSFQASRRLCFRQQRNRRLAVPGRGRRPVHAGDRGLVDVGAIDSRLVVDALAMAIARQCPGPDLVAHSDRGVQYASEHYQRLLTKHGITCSMSRKGNCWDKAPMESFFATLKKELVHHEEYETRAAARHSLFEYIEVFYNRVRRHSALGYQSPTQFVEAAYPFSSAHKTWGSPRSNTRGLSWASGRDR